MKLNRSRKGSSRFRAEIRQGQGEAARRVLGQAVPCVSCYRCSAVPDACSRPARRARPPDARLWRRAGQEGPVTGISAPWTAFAASEQRKRITAARSAGATHFAVSAFGMAARFCRRVDGAGQHAIDVDALAAQFSRKGFGDPEHRALGGHVGAHTRGTLQCPAAPTVTILPAPRAAHARNDGPRRVDERLRVDVHHARPVVGRGLADRLAHVEAAGRRADGVDGSKLRLDAAHRVVCCRRIGQVDGDLRSRPRARPERPPRAISCCLPEAPSFAPSARKASASARPRLPLAPVIRMVLPWNDIAGPPRPSLGVERLDALRLAVRGRGGSSRCGSRPR